MERIIGILEINGPLLSGDLARRLEEKFAISAVAARKIISRSGKPVRRLYNLNFDNNQKFFYLDSQFGTQDFFDKLLEILRTSSKAYYAFINAMLFHNGYINKNQLPGYSFSPIKPLKGHRNAQSIIEELLKSKIIINYNEEVYQLDPSMINKDNYSRFKAIEIAKKITLDHFNEWTRKTNSISYNTAKFSDDTPEFYNFQWSFTAPSYLGVEAYKNLKPSSFMVADILFGEQIEESDIDYLLKKIKIIYHAKNSSRLIPVIIFDQGISEEALNLLKKTGIMLGFVDHLFGNKYSEILKTLISVMENASAIISKNPDEYLKLMGMLTDLTGKSHNIKGDLFELAVGYYYSFSTKYLLINKEIKDPKTQRSKEIDVFAKGHNNEVVIIECKGYGYSLDVEYVHKWLTDNIPTIRNWLANQDEYANHKQIFEIWSTGGFSKEAKELLDDRINSTKKYTIRYLGREEIIKAAKEIGNQNLQKIIKDYFPPKEVCL